MHTPAKLFLLALGLLIALVSQGASAQQDAVAQVDKAFNRLEPPVREVVESYLRTDCEIGEVGIALKRVLQVGNAVAPYLTAVVRGGPPSAARAVLERGLSESWEARQAFLKTPDAQELGPESFAMMKAITEDAYRKDQRGALDAKYRERAALALRAMEGTTK